MGERPHNVVAWKTALMKDNKIFCQPRKILGADKEQFSGKICFALDPLARERRRISTKDSS